MKKVTLLATIILTLAMCASAQQLVDFTQLPASGSPQPIPNGYDGLRWDAIEFVSAPLYDDANLYIGANGAVNSGRGFFTRQRSHGRLWRRADVLPRLWCDRSRWSDGQTHL